VNEHIWITGPEGCLETVQSGDLGVEKGIAIICHPHPLFGGSLNNKVVTTLHKTFSELGISTLRFNFRGVGQSEGQYDSGMGELADLQAVIDWAKKKRPDALLWLAGFSFGAFIAFQAAALNPCQQVILIAPPVQHFDFTREPVACPCLIIQGDADEVVPADLIYNWSSELQFAHELYKMAGASHFFHGKLTDLKELLKDYLIKKHAHFI